jgi:hypothetical protein
MMLPRLLLLVLALSCVAPRVWAKDRVIERFALVIGNNRPLGSRSAMLRYADDDAVATQRLLVEAGVDSLLLASFDADTRRMFPETTPFAAPRVEALERAYAALLVRMRAARERGSDIDFLFFYGGHGDVDNGEGFVVLENGKLTRSQLFALLSRSLATRNHVFIDACKSYFIAFDRGPGGQREPYLGSSIVAAVPAQLDNTGFVLSTSSDRDSHEWERFQGGILSHELRSALRGAADTNLDRRVSYAEVAAFLDKVNQSIPNPHFRPDFFVRAPGGNLRETVLNWSRSRASLSFRAGDWGHFYIENARGDRLLDAHPASSQALILWTPDERPLFVRRNDGQAEYVVNARQSLEVTALAPSTLDSAPRGALSLALDRLFEIPFGDNDVRRFEGERRADAAAAPSPLHPAVQRRLLRWTSGTIALVAASGGLAFSTLAIVDYARGANESQRRIQELNERVDTFNRASLACYGTALVAGTIWGLASFLPNTSLSVTPTNSDPRFAGLSVDLRGRF